MTIKSTKIHAGSYKITLMGEVVGYVSHDTERGLWHIADKNRVSGAVEPTKWQAMEHFKS